AVQTRPLTSVMQQPEPAPEEELEQAKLRQTELPTWAMYKRTASAERVRVKTRSRPRHRDAAAAGEEERDLKRLRLHRLLLTLTMTSLSPPRPPYEPPAHDRSRKAPLHRHPLDEHEIVECASKGEDPKERARERES